MNSAPLWANRNHDTDVMSEKCGRGIFEFIEIVWKGLKQATLSKIMTFASHFSLKLYIWFWKYFQSMALCSVGCDYY